MPARSTGGCLRWARSTDVRSWDGWVRSVGGIDRPRLQDSQGGAVRARPLIVPVLLGLLVLTQACRHDQEPAPAASAEQAPSLGASAPESKAPPHKPMDGLERQVAERLARQVAPQGLTLGYLDCPHWSARVPVRISCRAYVDGVVAAVRVRLRAAVQGKAVGFDADLANGVIATRRLEQILQRQGARDAYCGKVAAYPAVRGTRIVCRERRDGSTRYVVATVASSSGRVMVADYRGATPTP